MEKRDALYPRVESEMRYFAKRIGNSGMSQQSKEDLTEFVKKLEAMGISPAQRAAYLVNLVPIGETLGKPFRDATRKDMENLFTEYRRRGYAAHTFNKRVGCIKCFYRWLYGLESDDRAPEPVRWLKKEPTPPKLRAENLVTEEDMRKLMAATRTLRDKCIISVLFEAGLRPGELRALKIKDVNINGDMVRLYVAGKTRRKSGERLVPILRSYNLMRMWLSEHPGRDDPEAWLWTFDKEPLGETNLRMLVWNLMKKAKVSKPRNPYIFRHSALTRFYRELPGTVASKLAGHASGSKEAATYTHLSAEDLENAVRTLNGVQKKENVESFKCHKCNQTLGIGDRLCPACGLAQDNEVALKVANETQNAVDFMKGLDVLSVQSPELKELKDKMQELVSRMLDKESRHP